MSYLRGWLAVNLKPVDRIPLLGLVDRSILKEFYGLERVGGLEAYRVLDVDLTYTHGVSKDIRPRDVRRSGKGFFEEFKDDFPYTDLFPIAYRGLRLTRTGTSDQLWVVERPFKTYGDVLKYLRHEFDPVSWEKRSLGRLVENYSYSYRRLQEPLRDTTLVAGEIYLTLFTFFLVHLGHRFTLLLLKRNPDVFEEAAERYVLLAERHAEAWARTGIRVFVSHDDIAMKNGPMVSPELFEEHVAPFYPRIWRPLRERGVKIIFVSDGRYMSLLDALVAAGVTGFKINWDAMLSKGDVEWLVERYGGRYVLSLGPRYRVMAYGSLRDAEKEAKWFLETVKDVKGFFLSNVAGRPENVKAFWRIWMRECWLE